MKNIYFIVLCLIATLLVIVIIFTAQTLAHQNILKDNTKKVAAALDSRKAFCGAYKNNPQNLPQDNKPRCSWITYNDVKNPDFYWIMNDLVQEGFLDKMIEGVADEGGKTEKVYTFCEFTEDKYCIVARLEGREIIKIQK